MGYVDGILFGTFTEAEDGTWSFYPYGRPFDGYRLPDASTYRRARRATVAFIFGGAISTFFAYQTFSVLAAVVWFAVATALYLAWARQFGVGYERVPHPRIDRIERYRQFADALGSRTLWFLLVDDVILLAVMVGATLLGRPSPILLLAIGIFAIGGLLNASAILDQRRRRSRH